MTSTATDRRVIEAFYKALCVHDYAAIAGYLSEDARWTINGPIDVLPFCGTYRGLEAITRLLEKGIPTVIGARVIESERFLIDGEHAAGLGRIVSRHASGKTISYRLAIFLTFSNGKLVDYCSVLDSFDAVEQVVGKRLTVNSAGADETDDDSLFVV